MFKTDLVFTRVSAFVFHFVNQSRRARLSVRFTDKNGNHAEPKLISDPPHNQYNPLV